MVCSKKQQELCIICHAGAFGYELENKLSHQLFRHQAHIRHGFLPLVIASRRRCCFIHYNQFSTTQQQEKDFSLSHFIILLF